MSGQRRSRRRFLKAAGAAAVSTALSGCGDATNREFTATPYAIGAEGMALLNFEEAAHEAVETEREASVEGFSGEVRLTSHVVSYGREATTSDVASWLAAAEHSWSAGVLSTPAAAIANQPLNPLAREPVGELLEGERGRQLLANAGLGAEAEWVDGPVRFDAVDAELLGRATELAVYGGIVENESGVSAVALYVTRVRVEGDAVLVGLVDRRAVGRRAVQSGAAGSDGEGSTAEDGEEGGAAGARQAEETAEPTPEPTSTMPPTEPPVETTVEASFSEEMVDAILGRSDRVVRIVGTVHGFDVNSVPDPEDVDVYFVHLRDPRLVQTVENSEIRSGSNSGTTVSDPPLVIGRGMAAVFDLDGTNLDLLPSRGIRAEVTITHPSGSIVAVRDSFRIPGGDVEDIVDGAEPAAKFHELARDGSADTDPPVFATDPERVTVTLTSADGARTLDSQSWRVTDKERLDSPLRVGFIHVKDPGDTHSPVVSPVGAFFTSKDYRTDVDWGDDHGEARNYERSVRSSFEYLKRVYPGEVVAYRHDTPMVALIRENWNGAASKDAARARNVLNLVRQQSGFPSGGAILTEGMSTGAAADLMDADRGGAFDVRVMILPRGTGSGNTHYFDAHWGSNPPVGYFYDLKKAVGSLEALRGGQDVTHSHITTQEIAHRYSFSIYTGALAAGGNDQRHVTSTLESVGYDLTDGRFSLISDVSVRDGTFSPGSPPGFGSNLDVSTFRSYMKPTTGGDVWADSKIQQFLLEGQFTPGYSGGGSPATGGDTASPIREEPARESDGDSVGDARGGEASGGSAVVGAARETVAAEVQPIVEASGSLGEEGVDLEMAWVYDGVPQDAAGGDYEAVADDPDVTPVDVAVVGPAGEELVAATVPDRIGGSHGHRVHEGVSVSLPFPERGVSLVAEREGERSRMNAVVYPLRFALYRVDEAGFEAEGTRPRLLGVLDEVAERMDAGEYGGAAGVLREEFRPALDGAIVEYEGYAGQPDREELSALTGRMTERLEAMSG